MNASLRTKLFGIAGIATLALAIVAVVGVLSAASVAEQLREIETRHIPRLELRPLLRADLERLSRGFQDAAAAEDPDLLDTAQEHYERFVAHLAAAESALDHEAVVALREALSDYYETARDVTRRLIDAETGEDLLDAMGAMQEKQARVLQAIDTAAALDERELETAFGRAVDLQDRSVRFGVVASVAGVFLVGLLALWITRQIVRSLSGLNAGLTRFGRGEFDPKISLEGDHELTEVARRANEMAASLEGLGRARDRSLFIGEGLAGLAAAVRGDLSVAEVAANATRFLATYLGAPIAALYYDDGSAILTLIGGHAIAAYEIVPTFQRGEGLVGEAVRAREPQVIDGLPEDYLPIRSGLGETSPHSVALVPLIPDDEPMGVLELGFLKEVDETSLELLASASTSLAVAIEVARARAVSRTLLSESLELAEQLTAQEEELRATNEELEAQQEELRQMNEELTQQTDALEENNRDLKEARAALELHAGELATVSAYKSQFLTNMSHELRTPLNSMLLLSNLLADNQEGNLTDKQVSYARTVHNAGQELLTLINQILDLAKVEAGKIELELSDVSLGDLAEYVRDSFGPVARAKGLDLHVEVAASVPAFIVSDRPRVLQIMNNLIANAIKFTDRGSVTLRVFRPSSAVNLGRDDLSAARAITIEVSDTGLGIDEAHHDRIFAAFEQADASIERRHGGTGLGLAISRELAELLGGALLLESKLGEGSTFRCHLPEGGPTEAAARLPVRRPEVARAPAPRQAGEPERRGLLVVEDDEAFAQGLAEIITRQGHEVFIARDGETALALARKHLPLGIILDVKLPDIDGWTVMERLKRDPATASIPVHCVSGLDGAMRAASLGAIGYLQKPASREDLLGVVSALAPGRNGAAPEILVVEDDAVVGASLMKELGREGISARRVSTASSAIAALEERSFDCVVMDLGLPDMDGLDLIVHLDERGSRPLPSLIVYTARGLSMAETRRLEAYADAVVLKDGASVERVLNEIRLFAGGVSPRSLARAIPKAVTREPSLRGRSILVVDDDMRTVYALSAMLRSKGFEVKAADTGVAALAALEDQEVHAILMDIMMPEMDGYTAMKRIRGQTKFGTLPIIALTAKAMKGDEERCIAAGATAYLPKPVDSERLLALLHTLLAGEP